MIPRLLLFDLDGTLLRSDKTISPRTLAAVGAARERGALIGVSTSRSELNCLSFLPELTPDLVISSGGALVRAGGKTVFSAAFSPSETRSLIALAREVCGADVELTADTERAHYWNYKVDPTRDDKTWGGSVWTDFSHYDEDCFKLCVQIFDEDIAETLRGRAPDCDMVRFSGSFWYKLTPAGITKETAILRACEALGLTPADVAAFGDDLADVGMLQLAGLGVAMGNAPPEVRLAADAVTLSNDDDGVAVWLEEKL